MIALVAPLALAGGGLVAVLLRRAQRGQRAAMALAGWGLTALVLVVSAFVSGPVKGVASALPFLMAAALGVVWTGRVRREGANGRSRSLAPEPLESPSQSRWRVWWRGFLRFVLAGPLGMVAAMAVAFCLAVYLPGDPRTRIVIGGLAMPILWGLAMTWTLADGRLLRALAVLAGASAAGFFLAFLGGAG